MIKTETKSSASYCCNNLARKNTCSLRVPRRPPTPETGSHVKVELRVSLRQNRKEFTPSANAQLILKGLSNYLRTAWVKLQYLSISTFPGYLYTAAWQRDWSVWLRGARATRGACVICTSGLQHTGVNVLSYRMRHQCNHAFYHVYLKAVFHHSFLRHSNWVLITEQRKELLFPWIKMFKGKVHCILDDQKCSSNAVT